MSLSKPLGYGAADASFLRRLAAPFEELWEDAVCSCQDGASAVHSVCTWEGYEDAPAWGVASASSAAQPLWQAARGGLARCAAPILELADEDPGAVGTVAVLACAAPAAVVGGPIVLAGLVFKTKVVYAVLGFTMLGGAWNISKRYPDEQDRIVVKRSTAIMLISGGLHLALAAGVGLPPEVAAYVAHPDVVAKLLPELVCTPLLIWNLGYLAGKHPGQMVLTTAAGVMGTACYIVASAVSPEHALRMVLLGAGCMLKAGYSCNAAFPAEATALSTINKLRTQISADLLVFGWFGYPLAMCLKLTGCIDEPAELHAYALLDLLGKIGVTHIILRSADAFTTAVHYHVQHERAPLAPPQLHDPHAATLAATPEPGELPGPHSPGGEGDAAGREAW